VPISQIREKEHPQLSLKSFGLFDLISAQFIEVHGHLSDLKSHGEDLHLTAPLDTSITLSFHWLIRLGYPLELVDSNHFEAGNEH